MKNTQLATTLLIPIYLANYNYIITIKKGNPMNSSIQSRISKKYIFPCFTEYNLYFIFKSNFTNWTDHKLIMIFRRRNWKNEKYGSKSSYILKWIQKELEKLSISSGKLALNFFFFAYFFLWSLHYIKSWYYHQQYGTSMYIVQWMFHYSMYGDELNIPFYCMNVFLIL